MVVFDNKESDVSVDEVPYGVETPKEETAAPSAPPKISTKRRVAGEPKFIAFFNLPGMLKKDCEMEYSVLKLIINYSIAIIAICVIGMLYALEYPYIIALCITYFVFGPSLIYYKQRRKYEQYKFTGVVRYIEQMIYSFSRRSKILDALQETRILMSGKIAEAIDFAIGTLQHGENRLTLFKDALKYIEDFYPCTRVKNLHEFMIDVEEVGGRHNSAMDIMLEDVREWDVRVNNFRQDRLIKGYSLLVSIFMSLGVCFFMTNILPDDMGGDITGYLLYQVLTTASLIVMFIIYCFASRKLTRSWVNDDTNEDERALEKDYDRVKAYYADPNGKLKPTLAKIRVQSSIEKNFPRWIMRLALLASSRPIANALMESAEGSPIVIKKEVNRISAMINENPTSIEPYIAFFEEFANELPQIRSLMMMIYSLSEADASEADKHVLSIVKRNQLLQATAEKTEDEEKMTLFTLFTTVPMILACVIMMLDVGMIVLNMVNTVM